MITKTILITGGAGFIGSHTCSILLERNYKIYVVDNLSNTSAVYIKRLRSKKIFNEKNKLGNQIYFGEGDIRDFDYMKFIFQKAIDEKTPIDSVLHFAGMKSVSDSVIYPIKYWENNVSGTINLLKVMELFNCFTLVFSSSATIYGNSKESFFLESSEINPVNPYGQTKSVIEKFLNDIYDGNTNNWRIANLRYFNPIGAHPSGALGEETFSKVSNIFPIILDVASGKIKKLEVFGKDWPTNDGTCVRDYIHVMDLAEAHIAALNYLSKKKSKFINFNIGTGKGTTVLELIRIFEEVNSCKVPFVYTSRRAGDVPISVANNSLALDELNWSPQRTIQEMCKDGWLWQKNKSKNF